MEGHAVHDDASYVPKEMLTAWAASDPLERFRAWLVEQVAFSDAEDEELAAEVKALLADALRRAEESPLPDGATVAEGVYA
jgi:TPP-dependent pyruvate/acetoin dehydrogenase alpha subunit